MAVRDPLTQLGGAYAVPSLLREPDKRDTMLTSQDMFILSRIDGKATVADIAGMVGLPINQLALTLLSMSEAGLVRMPASSSRPSSSASSSTSSSPAAASARAPQAAGGVSKPRPGRYSISTSRDVYSDVVAAQRARELAEGRRPSSFSRPTSGDDASPYRSRSTSSSGSRPSSSARDSSATSRASSRPTSGPRPISSSVPTSVPGRFSRPTSSRYGAPEADRDAQSGSAAGSTAPSRRSMHVEGYDKPAYDTKPIKTEASQPTSRERGATFRQRATDVLGFEPPMNFPIPIGRALTMSPDAVLAPAMEPEMREVVAYYSANYPHLSPHELLGVAADAPAKEVRSRYFQLSRTFHPDQWFRMDIGPFEALIHGTFRAITEAYESIQQRAKQAQTPPADAPRPLEPRHQQQQSPQAAVTQPQPAHPTAESSRAAATTAQFDSVGDSLPDLEALRKSALLARKQKNYKQAYELMSQVTAISSYASDSLRLAEIALEGKKELSVVQDALKNAHHLGDRSARWYALAGECALRAGSLPSATRGFRRALSIDPNEPLAKRRLQAIEARRD